MMKIGGTSTNIVLNPLNAIRSAATSALRGSLSTGGGNCCKSKMQQRKVSSTSDTHSIRIDT